MKASNIILTLSSGALAGFYAGAEESRSYCEKLAMDNIAKDIAFENFPNPHEFAEAIHRKNVSLLSICQLARRAEYIFTGIAVTAVAIGLIYTYQKCTAREHQA